MEILVLLLSAFALVMVKFLGNWAAIAYGIRRFYPEATAHPLLVAGLRTGLGILAAGVFALLGTATANLVSGPDSYDIATPMGLAVAYGGQLLFRALVWLLLVLAFYDRRLSQPRSALAVVAGGTVVSYLLDLPNYLIVTADLVWLLRDLRFC